MFYGALIMSGGHSAAQDISEAEDQGHAIGCPE